MAVEKVEALVVGAGQAGMAMSEHLSRAGVPHLVVERDRIAERWRTGRWDSLVANGPAWHDRFPGMAFHGDPEAFVAEGGRRRLFRRLRREDRRAVRCGVAVRGGAAQRRTARASASRPPRA